MIVAPFIPTLSHTDGRGATGTAASPDRLFSLRGQSLLWQLLFIFKKQYDAKNDIETAPC